MINTYKVKFVGRKQLTHDTFFISFTLQDGQILEFKAGQYLILMIPQPDGSIARRLYSVASPSTQKNSFDLLIKHITGGVASSYLAGLQPGNVVEFQGPAGMFVDKQSGKNKIFLATSTGIAPIRSMILTALQQGTMKEQYYLFWGLKTSHDLYFHDEMNAIAQKMPNFHYCVCLSREVDKTRIQDKHYCVMGRIDACFQSSVIAKMQKTDSNILNTFEYFLCGGINAVETLRSHLQNANVAKENIVFEKFV